MSWFHHHASRIHTWLTVAACAITLGAVSGCQSVNGQFYWPWEEPKVDNARQQRVQQDVALDRNQTEGIAQSQRMLDERVSRLEAASHDDDAVRKDVTDLKREVEQMRQDRETMRKEIVDELATRINKYMANGNGATPSPSSGKSSATVHTGATAQGGYNHKVEQGQTLEAIAKAYKTTVAKIMQANTLKDSRIRIGQTLFIPDPEK